MMHDDFFFICIYCSIFEIAFYLFIYSLYSQNLRMYSFSKHLCPRFGTIDLLFNTIFFSMYLNA